MNKRYNGPYWRIPTTADILIGLGLWVACVILAMLTGCGGSPVAPPSPSPTPTVFPSVPPTPVPCASPATCPPARVWKIGIRECEDVPYGESCLMDTTPFFVGGRCNSESSDGCPVNSCGLRRECEPPESDGGPDFFIVSGGSNIDGWVRNPANSYQIRLLRVRGRVKVRACWPLDAKDQAGVPLDLSQASCGEVTVEPVR